MIKNVVLVALTVFLMHAACYEHPGLGWRWDDVHVGSVLNIYNHVRLDLTQRECRDKKRQALFNDAEVGVGS